MMGNKTLRSVTEILEFPEEAGLAQISQISFQRLVETIADGVLVVDLFGTVLYANPAAEQIFGYSNDELRQVPLGRPVVSGETADLTVHRPGKKPADIEMRVVEVLWEGQQALLATLRDVSAQRALEERRRRSRKLEAIGRLAAGVVHDFNNLLTVFDSGLRLLQKQISVDPASPKVEALIEAMLQRTQNGSALTQQLLAFSRQQSLMPEHVDLNARIDSLTGLLERTLGSDIKIETQLDPSLGHVFIDANQFDVAILNLAVNARDAMVNGGVLTLETSNALSDAEDLPANSGSLIRITVSDTGSGMTKDVLAKVFDPFFTTKEEGKGTGLGLSQVYGFVSQSGGHIRIDSQVGEGTQVHLYLPRGPVEPS